MIKLTIPEYKINHNEIKTVYQMLDVTEKDVTIVKSLINDFIDDISLSRNKDVNYIKDDICFELIINKLESIKNTKLKVLMLYALLQPFYEQVATIINNQDHALNNKNTEEGDALITRIKDVLIKDGD